MLFLRAKWTHTHTARLSGGEACSHRSHSIPSPLPPMLSAKQAYCQRRSTALTFSPRKSVKSFTHLSTVPSAETSNANRSSCSRSVSRFPRVPQRRIDEGVQVIENCFGFSPACDAAIRDSELRNDFSLTSGPDESGSVTMNYPEFDSVSRHDSNGSLRDPRVAQKCLWWGAGGGGGPVSRIVPSPSATTKKSSPITIRR